MSSHAYAESQLVEQPALGLHVRENLSEGMGEPAPRRLRAGIRDLLANLFCSRTKEIRGAAPAPTLASGFPLRSANAPETTLRLRHDLA